MVTNDTSEICKGLCKGQILQKNVQFFVQNQPKKKYKATNKITEEMEGWNHPTNNLRG